jgi:hypothetical protein
VLTNFATSAGDPQPPNFLIFLAIALSLYQYKAFRFVGERSIRFTDRERERELRMATKKFLVEVEKAKEAKDGRPSTGPVYRSLFAKGGFPEPIEGMESCWDVFRYGFLCLCLVAEKARRL